MNTAFHSNCLIKQFDMINSIDPLTELNALKHQVINLIKPPRKWQACLEVEMRKISGEICKATFRHKAFVS